MINGHDKEADRIVCSLVDMDELENMDLKELPLSARAFHFPRLKRGGYNDADDFPADTDGVGIILIRNCGVKSIGEIYARMFLAMASFFRRAEKEISGKRDRRFF